MNEKRSNGAMNRVGDSQEGGSYEGVSRSNSNNRMGNGSSNPDRRSSNATGGVGRTSNGRRHGNPRTHHFRELRELPDEELMILLQEGDDAALSVLYRRHARRILWYLMKLVGDRETAEDLTQETFFRVYRSRTSYRRIAKFTTWLYTIAGNLARSEYRKRRRTQRTFARLDSEPAELQIPDEQFRPDASSEAAITASRVLRALDLVPESFREVVVLRGMQELSYEEIRDITGVPLGTIKSRIHRGRAMLANLLADPTVG